jgi:mono/diheme cytochrome c family protein
MVPGRHVLAIALSSLLTAGLLCRSLPAATPPVTDAERQFVRDVLPVLKDKCFACHGDDPKDVRGALDLRTRDGLLAGGESGESSLSLEQPEESPLLLAVRRESDVWSAMPPKQNDRLSDPQIAALQAWIAAGALWPARDRLAEIQKEAAAWNASAGVQMATSGGLSPDWTDRRYDPANLWAYQPLKSVRDLAPQDPAQHPVDAFIDRRLAALGLPAAPRADRRTLIRRATFDLLGLPPAPEEIDRFLADPAPDDVAWARLLERLLASPHYGEQWGQHWLDVVRYADSSGYANDYERGNAWRYRDYVVRAFNADKPYDEFLREQIAGDETAEGAGPEPGSEQLIAVGFLRMGPWELTSMEVPKVARQRYLDDVTDIVGQTFLGHMLQCARCHDHKFDPVPTRDYYSIQAAFATTQLAERPAPFLPEENATGFEEQKYLLQRKEHYERLQAELDAKSIAAAREWYQQQKKDPAPFEKLLALPRPPRYDALRNQLLKQGIPEDWVPPRFAGFGPQDFGLNRVVGKGLERLQWRLDRYEPFALSVYSGLSPDLKNVSAPLRVPGKHLSDGSLDHTCILTGGDPFASGQPVTPGVLSVLDGLLAKAGSSSRSSDPPAIVGRRLELANWIASPQNPLTPRVMVNRLWLGHFGHGLAGNPNNFGATGKKPTHPELLDYLAAEFIARGWSVKQLHKLIMTSAAYRRSAQHPDPALLQKLDPLQQHCAAFRPRRLQAEELRDAMLLVSGELNPALGGIPVCPEINQEAALQPRQVMGTFAEAWQPSPLPSQRNRRSLYALRLRGLRDPFQEVFNAPAPEISCEARESSTVTPQVFALFNSQATFARALAWANRLAAHGRSESDTIRRAFLESYGRPASDAEVAQGVRHWQQMTARHAQLSIPPARPPREVIREAVEENTGEKFMFTEPLEAAVDFVPDLQPADVSPRIRGLAETCLVLLNSNEFAYVY